MFYITVRLVNLCRPFYKDGLLPKSRQYVHLSADIKTAKAVGKRHGRVQILQINTKQMHQDGLLFYQAENANQICACAIFDGL